VVIGNGTADHAAAFREEHDLPFELWVDPDMRAYRAAGLRRGLTAALNLKTLTHARRARRKGLTQTSIQGDPWQLGGVMLITANGQTVFRQVSQEAGDHADPQQILRAVESLARAGDSAALGAKPATDSVGSRL
jgi:hypothetical protein